MSRFLNPMSQTFTTEPMHSLPSQTAPGHNNLYKTFPTYAFLWNIHLYQKYIFLFCPFFLIGFGPFLVLILGFGPFLVFIQFGFQILRKNILHSMSFVLG